MNDVVNRRWVIAASPLGRPLDINDFRREDAAAPEIGADEILVRLRHLSMDPAQKSFMENISTYADATKVGDVMPGEAVGEVVRSNDPSIEVGARVRGMLGWNDYAVARLRDLDVLPDGVSDTAALGVVGTTGKTAYCGLIEIGKPKPGDVLVVSGAAGATGSVAGQIGKLAGCHVIGVAGGPEKCARLIEEFGFDAAIDYKAEKVRRRLKELAPKGVDIFYDNVGGEILNDCLARLAPGARVVICGAITRYNADPRDPSQMPEGPRNYFNLVHAGAAMQGFVLYQFAHLHKRAETRLARWVSEGSVKEAVDVLDGFERAPEALLRVYSGANFGKQLLRITD